ncbi:hypothetical protein E2C01_004489 [Portunus trituberculatus]|uniref:Uncharacterized protein n=1 Tax=Portunus trituberculatus TaxID=210409 RepID=A0A5B7CT45_PORTR|nr:hypothetical protein [Portunus trituberculatus]
MLFLQGKVLGKWCTWARWPRDGRWVGMRLAGSRSPTDSFTSLTHSITPSLIHHSTTHYSPLPGLTTAT